MNTEVMVKDTPLLMKGPLVCATLEDLKTQTRRLNGLKEVNKRPDMMELVEHLCDGDRWCFREKDTGTDRYPRSGIIKCPYGKLGDRLWMRETWQKFDPERDGIPEDRFGSHCPYKGITGGKPHEKKPIHWRAVYRADGEVEHPEHGKANWRPSIHMPRWASRINLEITSIRVERVQDISYADSTKEGVPADLSIPEFYPGGRYRAPFKTLWDSINAKRGYGWDKNPWVWVVEFKRLSVAS